MKILVRWAKECERQKKQTLEKFKEESENMLVEIPVSFINLPKVGKNGPK